MQQQSSSSKVIALPISLQLRILIYVGPTSTSCPDEYVYVSGYGCIPATAIESNNGGLSTGAAIGVGIVIGIGLMIVLMSILYCIRRDKMRKEKNSVIMVETIELPKYHRRSASEETLRN